jgi:hypothetical protein
LSGNKKIKDKRMKFKKAQNLKTIADLIGARYVGDAEFQVLVP